MNAQMFDNMPYLKLLLIKSWSHLAMSKVLIVLAASFAYIWDVVLDIAMPDLPFTLGITLLVVIDLMSGVYKSRMNSERHPWNWGRFWDGVLGKPIAYGLSIAAATTVAYIVPSDLLHFLEATFVTAIALKELGSILVNFGFGDLWKRAVYAISKTLPPAWQWILPKPKDDATGSK